MAVTPYQIAGTQRNLIDSLLSGEQQVGTGMLETKKKKGELKGEFEDELLAAQKKAEKELEKQRKKKWYEKALPFASLFGGPLTAGLVSAISSMYGLKQSEKHAKGQIEKAKIAAMLDPKWKKNFLSSAYKEQKEDKRKAFKEMAEGVDVSGMDLLSTGLMSGVTGWGAGKLMQGIGDAWTGAGEVGKASSIPAQGAGGMGPLDEAFGGTIGDIAKSVSPPGFSPGSLGFSQASIPNLLKQSGLTEALAKYTLPKGVTGSVVDELSGLGGRTIDLPPLEIGTGKLKEFTKLLKENLSEGGLSQLSTIFGDNQALLQNLLMLLQHGQQTFGEEG